MSLAQPSRDRRLLPRWQSSQRAISKAELASGRLRPPQPLDFANFEALKNEWRQSRSRETAAELIGAAIVLQRTEEVQAAARYVLDDWPEASRLLRALAVRVLNDAVPSTAAPQQTGQSHLDFSAVFSEIARLKADLRRHPRDVLARVDLVRLYAVVGQNEKAETVLKTALALGSNDRFVLRSAARFFVHLGDKNQALAVLRRSPALKYDPWLMAAEIAISQMAGRPSKTMAAALGTSDNSNWSARSRAELQGSIATQLLYDGRMPKARRMYLASLEDPTENAVAQAQWAVQKDSNLIVPGSALSVPDNFETNALRARSEHKWKAVVDNCWAWADYEPTSTRPMSLGSYVATVAMADAPTALEFTERGLAIDPSNSSLQNNRVVALAYLGRVDEAVEEMGNIVIKGDSDFRRPVLLATAGLLKFRMGDIEGARAAYVQALDLPEARRDRSIQALARWHWALEEAVAGTGKASDAAVAAQTVSKSVQIPEIVAIAERVRLEIDRQDHRSS